MDKLICPRCGEEKMADKLVWNSLSRRDNKTYVCNDCGTEEAFVDMGLLKEREWHVVIPGVKTALRESGGFRGRR